MLLSLWTSKPCGVHLHWGFTLYVERACNMNFFILHALLHVVAQHLGMHGLDSALTKPPGRSSPEPCQVCSSSNWALRHRARQELVHSKNQNPKHIECRHQVLNTKYFPLLIRFYRSALCINADIVSIFSAPQIDCTFGDGDVWAHTYLVVKLLVPTSAGPSITTCYSSVITINTCMGMWWAR